MITSSPLLLTKTNAAVGDVAPDAPTSFSATDVENCQITCTWTDSTVGTPSPKYDIYEDGTIPSKVATDVTSPAVLDTTYGTKTYYVKSYNYIGGVDSNTDSGTGVDTRPVDFTIAGTTDEELQITFTWTEAASSTFELHKDGTLVASGISSPYVYSVNPDLTNEYFIRATNSCGYKDSTVIDSVYSVEVPTLANVITDGDYIYMTVLSTSNYSFTRSEWHVVVDGVEDTSGSAYKLSGAGETLRIGQFKYIYSGQTVTVTHDSQEATIAPFTAMAVTNNSTLTNGTSVPPIYEMTEPLNQIGTYYYLDNSSFSGEIYDGRLEHSSKSTDGTEGDAWSPTTQQYNQLGWIDLSVNGNAVRQIDTQWIPLASTEWNYTSIYDVILGNSYSIVVLHYNGDNTADIYRGSNGTGNELSLSADDTGLLYTPILTEFIINKNINYELIPIIPIVDITMSSYALGAGETATVTFTFNTIPLGFTVGDITADNGAISSLTQSSDEWIYTATFTPTTSITDPTNVITVSGALGEFTDQWSNPSDEDFTSSNYTVDTATSTELWDGTWYDDQYYFDETSVPTSGEVCGVDNLVFYVDGGLWTTNDIDVSAQDNVQVIITGGNRFIWMFKQTNDGLCRYGNTEAYGEPFDIDTSNMDNIRVYAGSASISTAPVVSVKGI